MQNKSSQDHFKLEFNFVNVFVLTRFPLKILIKLLRV